MLSAVVDALLDPTTAVCCAVTVGLFAFGAYRYLRPVRQLKRQLQAAAIKLGKLSTPPKSSPFSETDSRLNELWVEFVKQRERAVVVVGHETVSTVAPEDVFTDFQLLRGYNRNMAVTLAGVFTALGILGTFIGLVIGMTGLDMSSDNLLNSINRLLGGMSTAFYTSIFGIVFSLLWLFLDRASLRSLQQATGDFFRAVRKHYPVESADELLHRLLSVEQDERLAIHKTNHLLAGQQQLLEEQKVILQNLGSDLVSAFQLAMEKSFNSTLTPALSSMTDAVQDLSVKIGDRQVEALEEMVKSFEEQLALQLGGQLQSLAESIKGAAEWHERVHTNVQQLMDRVASVSTKQLDLLQASSEVVDRFDKGVEALSTAHELVARSTEHLQGAADHTRSLAEALDARVSEIQAQLDVYREANSEIRDAIAAQLDAVVEQTTSLTAFWSEFRVDLNALGSELKTSVVEFRTVTEEKLGQIFSRFDGEMAKVVEHLAGTLAEIREVTEVLPANVERLNRALEHALGTAIPQSIGKLDTALSERMAGLEGVRTAVDELKAAVGGATAPNGDLNRVTEAVQRASSDIQQLGSKLDETSRVFSELLGRRANAGDGALKPVPAR